MKSHSFESMNRNDLEQRSTRFPVLIIEIAEKMVKSLALSVSKFSYTAVMVLCAVGQYNDALCQNDVASSQKMTIRALPADTLYWYGVDFSKVIIYDYQITPHKDQIKSNLCPSWLGVVRQLVKPYLLPKKLGSRVVIDKSLKSLESCNYIDIENAVALDGVKELSLKTIEQELTGLQLDESSGIGFIIYVSKISRTNRNTEVIGVFFNVNDRRILFNFSGKGGLKDGLDSKLIGESISKGVKKGMEFYKNHVLNKF